MAFGPSHVAAFAVPRLRCGQWWQYQNHVLLRDKLKFHPVRQTRADMRLHLPVPSDSFCVITQVELRLTNMHAPAASRPIAPPGFESRLWSFASGFSGPCAGFQVSYSTAVSPGPSIYRRERVKAQCEPAIRISRTRDTYANRTKRRR